MPLPWMLLLKLATRAELIALLPKTISALKEPLGKKGVEELRQHTVETAEQLFTLVDDQSRRIDLLQAQNLALTEWVKYLALPFYKRWVTAKPPMPPVAPVDTSVVLADLPPDLR